MVFLDMESHATRILIIKSRVNVYPVTGTETVIPVLLDMCKVPYSRMTVAPQSSQGQKVFPCFILDHNLTFPCLVSGESCDVEGSVSRYIAFRICIRMWDGQAINERLYSTVVMKQYVQGMICYLCISKTSQNVLLQAYDLTLQPKSSVQCSLLY